MFHTRFQSIYLPRFGAAFLPSTLFAFALIAGRSEAGAFPISDKAARAWFLSGIGKFPDFFFAPALPALLGTPNWEAGTFARADAESLAITCLSWVCQPRPQASYHPTQAHPCAED